MYRENPKTKGSGIVAIIPQTGICPNMCEDCFFQSGRSYLEPLDKNLPNIPDKVLPYQVVRVNDGNDSNVDIENVIETSKKYSMKFYNTAIPELDKFDAPVVLTINPGPITNKDFHRIIGKNLMFVRFRTNTWNVPLAKAAVQYYSDREVPIVLTFMAYFDTAEKIPSIHKKNYAFRKRTLNSYYAITTHAWEKVMKNFKYNKWVSSCGKIEGEKGTTSCRFCGNCLREYFATMERIGE
ncbi:MAG: hypothetical protein PVG65_05270 [Candidatus Thorarchaeota archaeon]|jgi:hypothetical protein